MKYMVTLHGKNYEVEVEKGEALLVSVTDTEPPAVPAVPAAPVVPVVPAAPASPAAPISGARVDSPLPGTVVDIRVAAGSAVKKGEIIIIIEAMKMENEVVSPRDGVVSQIICTKGATVKTGDPLIALV